MFGRLLYYYQSPLRICFLSDSFRLLSNLACIDDFDGLDFFRGLGLIRLFATNSCNLLKAICLFSSCDLVSLLFTMRYPSLLMRFFSLSFTQSFSSGFSAALLSICHQASTIVSTLFTFWPPLPPLRAVR